MANLHQHSDYDKDFYAWALESAELLRQKKFDQIDIEHIAEEIESMGKSNKRSLINHLSVLITHLLKCKFQAERRGTSWENTIERQRIDIQELLEESPSLKHEIELKFSLAYKRARLDASSEMGIKKNVLPEKCPFSLSQCLDNEFFPD
jgi:Domain of unknown function DUF29